MAITFVTTGGPWPDGTGAPLPPGTIDENIWTLLQMILGLSDGHANQGIGILNITQSGDTITIFLTDNTSRGPFTLPTPLLNIVGSWAPNTVYAAGDIFSHGDSIYSVITAGTSPSIFNPAIYTLLLTISGALPTGGVAGYVLVKQSSTDFDALWQSLGLADLYDVSITSPGPSAGDTLTFDGAKWSLAQGIGAVSFPPSPGPANGDVLTFQGSSWTYGTPITYPIAIGATTAGSILQGNGTAFADSLIWDKICPSPIAATGTLALDRVNGESQRISLTGDVTAVTVDNWPPAGQRGELELEIVNTAAWAISGWPAGTIQPGGTPYVSTTSGNDLISLSTRDGGTTIYLSIIGQAYA